MINGTIAKYRKETGMSTEELCMRTGIKEPTFYLRMRNPDAFRIGEIKAICKVLGIPRSEVFSDV